ncbi:cobyrinate a,c-diamide synthase [Paenibacillus silvae]|nr:cobyrinate a,c-diamide synthase [Paenibacillus silvae]
MMNTKTTLSNNQGSTMVSNNEDREVVPVKQKGAMLPNNHFGEGVSSSQVGAMVSSNQAEAMTSNHEAVNTTSNNPAVTAAANNQTVTTASGNQAVTAVSGSQAVTTTCNTQAGRNISRNENMPATFTNEAASTTASDRQAAPRAPRLIIAGTGSGAGKTTVTLGLMKAIAQRGLSVQGFKCGPDYIDPTYHTAVTGRASRNLDAWMTSPDYVRETFARASAGHDISIIEGVMGLYDGKDPLSNTGSTAEIAMVTQTPVILVVDVRSMARSAAAIVLGFQQLEPELHIAGVIVNRCGSAGHYTIVKKAIEQMCGIPVVGWLKRDEDMSIPERHLGLVPAIERGELEPLFQRAADVLLEGTDLDLLLELAASAPPLQCSERREYSADHSKTAGTTNEDHTAHAASTYDVSLVDTDNSAAHTSDTTSTGSSDQTVQSFDQASLLRTNDTAHSSGILNLAGAADEVHTRSKISAEDVVHANHVGAASQSIALNVESDTYRPVIAVARDAAFNFYYPDNLELLEAAGARLQYFSPLAGESIPAEADSIYLGGGFPEEFAAVIAGNERFLKGLREAVRSGMPLFAECGGYMVLGETLTDREGVTYTMAGIIPAHVQMQKKRAALGYREASAVQDSFLLKQGEMLRGHEFHYSTMTYRAEDEIPYAYETKGLRGLKQEGYAAGSVVAGYTHIHLGSYPAAAQRWVHHCKVYRQRRTL